MDEFTGSMTKHVLLLMQTLKFFILWLAHWCAGKICQVL